MEVTMGAEAPTSELDLWSSDVLLDPWDHFREVRNTAPAVYLERYDVYAVGRYRDVRAVLRDWQTFTSADGVAFNDPFPTALELLQEIGRLTKDDMTPGSMGWSLFEAEERGEIPPDSTTMLIWNYIGPAFDTTINGIGSTVWMLARDPEQWKILRDDPGLIPSAFNEGLRMETPISIWARGCRHGAEIDGLTIPPGTRLCVLLGSANRDERHYPDPDHYDVRRDPHDHVAFGHGIHSCVGSSLARTEAHAVLTALVNQVTTMECGEPVREPHSTTRGLAGLPMEVSAAS